MNELKIFENSEFGKIGILEIDGKLYFAAKKCAQILGHTNPERAIREFCKGVTETVTPTNGGMQAIKIIPEGDLYRLIARSKLPSAEKFERWVFDEVLPTIRKTGGYVNNDDLFIATYLPNVDEETRQLFRASLQSIRALSEKVDTLEVALNQSLQYYTVAKYNKVYKMGWNLKECSRIGKKLTAYCIANSIKIKVCETNDERFGEVNSYPLTAWESCFAPETV